MTETLSESASKELAKLLINLLALQIHGLRQATERFRQKACRLDKEKSHPTE